MSCKISPVLVLVLATVTVSSTQAETALSAAKPKQAVAEMEPRSGSATKGTIRFAEGTQGLEIEYNLSGLTKNQKHGMHIHENGDCSAPDAKSAGKHYKEVASSGGTSLDNSQKFAGDLPQITADAEGRAKGKLQVSQLSLDKKNAVENRAIIVHGGPDDITKKSAPRVACGVIKRINKE